MGIFFGVLLGILLGIGIFVIMGAMNYDNNYDNNRNERDRLDPEIFSAIITPHRSLGPRGFLVFMLCLGGLSFIAGVIFVSLGAWPVFGFFGLDVLLRLFRVPRQLSERARLRGGHHHQLGADGAQGFSHRGGVRQWTLNPLWVRLERIVHAEFGIERLFLVSHGRRLMIARFLSPAEKASFAHALSQRARRGQARTDKNDDPGITIQGP